MTDDIEKLTKILEERKRTEGKTFVVQTYRAYPEGYETAVWTDHRKSWICVEQYDPSTLLETLNYQHNYWVTLLDENAYRELTNIHETIYD